MADSTPLLSESDSPNSSETRSLQKPLPFPSPSPSLDDVIEQYLTRSGKSQFLQAFLISFACFFDAQQTFITIFTDAQPKWHCTTSHPALQSSCNAEDLSALCRLPAASWSWDLPKHASTVSDWSLHCSASVVAGLPASSYFLGCLLGGFLLSTLADSSLGRKQTLFLSSLLMSTAAFLAALSPNVWIYSLLKFLSGFGRSTIGSCALVLSTETVEKRWRGQVGIGGFFCFSLGFLSLPAVAFLNRGSSWRVLYLYTSLPTLFYCVLIYVAVRESPRWLFVQGRKEEAVATLKSIAPSLTASFSGMIPVAETTYSSLKVLVQKRWALRRLLAAMAVGFGIGIVYYGMPLAVGSLPFDFYLSVTFNALAEVPSALATVVLIDRMNRRTAVMVFGGLSGICSVACAWAGTAWDLGMELTSFFSACTAFNAAQIYTIELFPTCVRNSAASLLRQAIMFGGVFSPVLIAAGRGGRWLSFGVFGLAIGLCALFAVFLPETRGRKLCDTMEEEEQIQQKSAKPVTTV
ncbi:organic cation/carnitine transporter 3-like [Malania oleifera]|uniref:organic cation/carnitine transporter 3-like n=1 Tax=Malania oleifera TaxID=397392 RepID=UPI0025AE3B90|nr:organic cation/carnitine transporter 3-like [Malania oleifera]